MKAAAPRRHAVPRATLAPAREDFDSGDKLLAALLAEELAALCADLEAGLAATPPGYLATVAHVTAGCVMAHPRLGRLLPLVPAATLRRAAAAFEHRTATALARVLPEVSATDRGRIVTIIANVVAGLWPGCAPSPAIARILARPGLSALRLDAERDLERLILVLLNGLTARGRRPILPSGSLPGSARAGRSAGPAR